MTYPTVVVNGVSVRVDADGRYCLNDLHAAAMANGQATESQRPSVFIRSANVKAFVKALKSALELNQPLKVIKGGDAPGIWGVELLAIRYAAWLSPKFEIRVYNTFRDAVLHGLSSMMRLNKLDLVIESETKEVSQCAKRMNRWGVGGRKQLLKLARERILAEIQPLLPGVE